MSLLTRRTTVAHNTANKELLFKEPKWVAAGWGRSGVVVRVIGGDPQYVDN